MSNLLNSFYTANGIANQISTPKQTYYFSRELTYEDIMSEVSNPQLPIIDKDPWHKISEMLSSNDIELVRLGFELMSGYRFPPGVINLTIINKAINKYLKEINN